MVDFLANTFAPDPAAAPPSHGFVCTDEEIQAAQRRPTPAEDVVIHAYWTGYEKAMGHPPHGLHYIPFPGAAETVAVWLPPAD